MFLALDIIVYNCNYVYHCFRSSRHSINPLNIMRVHDSYLHKIRLPNYQHCILQKLSKCNICNKGWENTCMDRYGLNKIIYNWKWNDNYRQISLQSLWGVVVQQFYCGVGIANSAGYSMGGNCQYSNKFDSSYTVQLRQLNFTYNFDTKQWRDCLISIGSHYLAIGSRAKNNVLIYNLLHLDLPPVMVNVSGNLTNMVMDIQQNLAIVFKQNDIHYFSYYVKAYESLEETESMQLLGYNCNQSQQSSIDYKLSQQENISLEYSVYCQKYESLRMIKIKTGSKKPLLLLSSQYGNSILLECDSNEVMIKYCFEQLSGLYYSNQNKICMNSGTIKMNTGIIDYCCSQDAMYGNHIIYVASYLSYLANDEDYYVDVLEDYSFARFWIFMSIGICLACLLCLHVTICQNQRCCFRIWNLCFCVAPDGRSCGFGTQHQICSSFQN